MYGVALWGGMHLYDTLHSVEHASERGVGVGHCLHFVSHAFQRIHKRFLLSAKGYAKEDSILASSHTGENHAQAQDCKLF